MTMKPILFNTEMVCAILDGYKTVTRRAVYQNADIKEFPRPDNPDSWWFRGRAYKNWDNMLKSPQGLKCSCKYHKGDILYVRETWNYGFIETPDQPGYSSEWFEEVDKKKASNYLKTVSRYFYRADMDDTESKKIGMRWRPSIHMPKEAARIFLRVTDVRFEQLQNLSADQLIAEGVAKYDPNDQLWFVHGCHKFMDVWNSTIKPADLDRYGYRANPWVWAIEFERIEKEGE